MEWRVKTLSQRYDAQFDDGAWNYTKNAPRLNQLLETPWRYRCPYCESHVIAVRQKIGHEKQYREGDCLKPLALSGSGSHVEIKDFRCEKCSQTFNDPYDKKRECRRTIRDEHSRIGGLGQDNA